MAEERRNPIPILVVLGILAFIFAFPFFWMLTTSVKSNIEALTSPETVIPDGFKIGNYRSIWDIQNIPRQTVNSAIMAFSVTFGQIVVAALAGYSFARLRFLGRDLLLVVFLATLIVPFEVIFVPLFIMMSGWGWTDTFWALIVPSLANPFAIFIFRQFFITIPRELEEAMRVDGAGYYRIFWSLMVPLSGPAIATVFILTFLAEWSALLKPLVFTSSEKMRTLQVGLSFLDRGAFVSEPKVAWLMAGVVIASIPPILVFLVMQERFVRSIASTGLKG